jgi:predicted nucleic acid-binding protein
VPRRRVFDSRRRTLLLDADGLSKLARRDRVVREMVRQEVVVGDARLVVPVAVVAQALDGGAAEGAVREVLEAAHEVAAVDVERAVAAGALMRRSGIHDTVDALVAVESLHRTPAIVVTSDPSDLRRLLEADLGGSRVAIWAV